jgi:sn-1 stearoyl-lipid 9-desaturase
MEFRPPGRIVHRIVKSLRTVKWEVAGGLLFIHAGALLAVFPRFFSWPALAVAVALMYLTGALGVTLCYHRTLTHRSMRLRKPLEYVTAVLGTLSLQGGPVEWVATHRAHHAHADKAGDPHDSNRGFSWAHMNWLYLANRAELTMEERYRMAADIARDPFYRFLGPNMLALQGLLALLLFVIGGWPFIVWGIFVRLVVSYHMTWLVNSAAHTTGYQTYRTGDRSTNCWWLALLSWGEGWHNNHHAFPFSARHGLRWFEIDHTWHIVKLLKFLKLADRVKLPTVQMRVRQLAK